jgi:alpha-beta hydrolase superfamily lysophospholipase
MSRNRVALTGGPVAVYRYCSTMSRDTALRRRLRTVRSSPTFRLSGLLSVALLVTFAAPIVVWSQAASATKTTWVDQNVTFTSGTMTIYATFRHPSDNEVVPGVLLIAGSGPTDRNGNSTLVPGPVDTLKTLADWLSKDGVASLRYDKLGSGQTGLGPYATNPDSIGASVFEQEARSALEFLANEKDVNDHELGVFGHSEGALFALLLATGHAGTTPPIHALGLIEPLSQRYLDLLTDQVDAVLSAEVKSGAIKASLEKTVQKVLASAVAQIRATGTVKSGLPYGLANLLNPYDALFYSQADRFDPAVLASEVARGTPVLLTCSNDDIQVTCGEVHRVAQGLHSSTTHVDFVHLVGVDHVLKVDNSLTGANYAKKLPFSPQLKTALKSFVAKYL